MNRNSWIVLCSAVFALGSSSGNASDGALEINQDCAEVGCFVGDTAGFPVTISVPGRYRLTSNLNTPTSGNINGIQAGTGVISSALFDIDLNGFEVFGGGNCTGTPVTSCTAGSTGFGIACVNNGQTVHIHGGVVRGFGTGILLGAAGSGSSIEDVVVTESSGTFSALNPQTANNAGIFFDRVRIVRNNGTGMTSSVAGRMFIRNSTFSGNREVGVSLSGGLTITDSTFADNGGLGLNCSGTCALGRNSFFNNAPDGTTMPIQFTAAALRDMGGNVCEDGTCP